MVCRSASAADRVCDCGDGVQWPKEKKPMCFMGISRSTGLGASYHAPSESGARSTPVRNLHAEMKVKRAEDNFFDLVQRFSAKV